MKICAYYEIVKEAYNDQEASDCGKTSPINGTMAATQEIVDLFYQAVWAINDEIYNTEQKRVWAPEPDYKVWQKRLAQKQPWLAIIDQQIAGFIELDPDGHIDCTYTHPKFQGKGVASALYRHLEQEARHRGIGRLYVEASAVAKPFFQRRGFTQLAENIIRRDKVTLSNFTMEKLLR